MRFYPSRFAIAPLLLGLLFISSGCSTLSEGEASAQTPSQGQTDETVAVETAIAATGSLEEPIEYTGTTQPIRQVSLRAQVEGRLLDLLADVGDPVTAGQTVAQLDDRILLTEVNEAQAELASLQSEVAQAEAEVSDALAQVERARVELQQARIDAERFQSLSGDGAITQQQAEQAQTAMLAAEQELRSAEEQVRTRQQAVVAAQGRVRAQAAVVAQNQERQAYTAIASPITGVVLEKVTEPGNLIQPGNELLKLGDFSAIKVLVQVSELALSGVRVGQPATVTLDAFPDQEFSGRVSRISPAADPTARLIPIEVTIPNAGDRIGSGLLARVQFTQSTSNPLVVPQSALEVAGEDNSTTIFVVQREGDQATAIARRVQIGNAANGLVEIRSGLQPGEAIVVRSSGSLRDGQAVRLSILSETQSP
jgi:RND family efflux transporter MFP subunit